MRHLMNTKTAVPCALVAILLGSSIMCADAFAAPASYEVATRTVKFGDLDLTRRAGAATLYSRIQNAAHTVCQPSQFSASRESLLLARHCVEQAISHAVADVNAPALTNYHFTETKRAITLARQP